MPKYYVTTPIYYVNAAPHVGSAYTTIAADVLARWHRQQGDDVRFLTGVAEHGTKIAQAAEQKGKTPQEFTDDTAQLFRLAWEQLNISHDDFIRTSEPRHEKAVKDFAVRLKKSGMIYEGEYEGLYCVGHEAFVKANELDEQGNCPDHGRPPETVKEQNWFFKLSAYEDELRQKITSGEFEIEPAARRNEVLSFLNQGLDDITISRRSVPWAIVLPWDPQQTLYVWLDELWNYQTAAEGFWPASIHLVGKDIIKFHCIIWPAILLAIGEPLPRRVFANGYLTVDGQKISKSLGNAVNPVEVATEYGADAFRYYLLRDIPFGNDGDFSHERLKERYNADLANGLGNLTSRTLQMIEKFAPELEPDSPTELDSFLTELGALIDEQAFDKALARIWGEVAAADALVEEKKPWELAKAGQQEEVIEVLTALHQKLVLITRGIAPFMPATASRLEELLEARPLQKPSEPLFIRK